MKRSKKIKAISTTILYTSLYFIPQLITKSSAANCNFWIEDQNDLLVGDAVDCIASNAFSLMAKLAVGLAILFTLFTIFKTFTSQGNSKAMEEIPTKWKYTIILIIAAGGGGAIISIILNFLGLPSFSTMWGQTWDPFIQFLNAPFAK